MDRITRTALMKEALGVLVHSDLDDFVVFEDRKTTDFVQFMLVPHFDDGEGPFHTSLPLTTDPSIPKAQMEVTARGLEDDSPLSGVSPISPAQDAAFKARGFDLELGPNYTVFIDLDYLDAIVDECEQHFMILGSAPTFELGVETGQ